MGILLSAIDCLAFFAWVGVFALADAGGFDPLRAALSRWCAKIARPACAAFRIQPRAAAAATAVALVLFRIILTLRLGASVPVAALPFVAVPPRCDPGERDFAALAAPAAFEALSLAAGILKIWTAWIAARILGAGADPRPKGYGACEAAAAPLSLLRGGVFVQLAAYAFSALALAFGFGFVSANVATNPELAAALETALDGTGVELVSSGPLFAGGAGSAAYAAGCALFASGLFAEGLGFAGRAVLVLALLRFAARATRNGPAESFSDGVLRTLEGRFAGPQGRRRFDWRPLVFWIAASLAAGFAANGALVAARAAEGAFAR